MKGLPEDRAVRFALYIIENGATVRDTAREFGISKSTVHKDVTERPRRNVPLVRPAGVFPFPGYFAKVSKRYPTFRTVTMCRPKSPSFRRRHLTWVSTVRLSPA